MGKAYIWVILLLLSTQCVISNLSAQGSELDESITDLSTRASSDDDWPMLYHDAGLSKYTSSSAPREKYKLWTFNETEFYRYGWLEVRSEPVVYDNKVFIGTTAEKLYALDVETGDEIWSVRVPIGRTIPAIADNILVFDSREYYIYAIDTDNGDILWKYNMSTNLNSKPIIQNGKLYIATSYNEITFEGMGLYCFDLDPSDHIDEGINDLVIDEYDLLWYQELDNVPKVVAIRNDKIYCIVEYKLLILDANDGSIIKTEYDEHNSFEGIPTIINDKLFIQSLEGTIGVNIEHEILGCYDPLTLETLWVFNRNYSSQDPIFPAGADNEVYYIHDGTLYALPFDDPNNDGVINDDEVLWTYSLEGYYSSLAVTKQELVVTNEDYLYCIDRPTGELIWKTRLYGSESYPPLAVVAYDKILISDDESGYNLAHFAVFSSYPSDFPKASLKVENNEYYTLTNIKFDSSGSTDDIGELKYRFDFGDGYNTTWLDEPIIYYGYQKLGNYTIDVLVKDIHGFTNRSKVKVNIKNRLPVLPTIKDKKIKEIEYIKIKNLGDQIYDLDGEIVYFELDFGEGKPWKTESNNGIKLSRLNYFDHEYHEPGKYTVTITIEDDDGAINTTSFKVTVEEKLFYEHVFPEYRWIYFGLCPAIFIIVIILIVLLLKRRKKNKMS